MSKRILINVNVYTDWDTPFKIVSLMAPEGSTKEYVSELASSLREKYANARDTEDIVKELKSLGYTPLKHYGVTIGGNL